MSREYLLHHLTDEKGLMDHFMAIASNLRFLKDGLSLPKKRGHVQSDGRPFSQQAPIRAAATRAAHPSGRQVQTDAGDIDSLPTLDGDVKKKMRPLVVVDDAEGGDSPHSSITEKLEHLALARGGAMEKNFSFISSSFASVKSEVGALQSQVRQKDDIIATLQGRVQQLEQALQAKSSENEDRDFRLSLIENTNFDGTMIWKVPQFSQRMEDARSGKYTSIFSLPFYSNRYGYKMCLRLYILGDGIGRSTHMSLFFVLMKGEFDNILPWPFTFKVTFKLLNQSGGRDITDVFQPDPLSSSFQKPKSDMNVASGCPRFVSLRELMSGGFIVDDTVFIKVRVDTANMKHP